MHEINYFIFSFNFYERPFPPLNKKILAIECLLTFCNSDFFSQNCVIYILPVVSYKELLRCKLTIGKVRIDGYKLAKLPFLLADVT